MIVNGDNIEDVELPEGATLISDMEHGARVLLDGGEIVPLSNYIDEDHQLQPIASPKRAGARRQPASWMDLPHNRFTAGLERRSKNRAALIAWLKEALVEGSDFGRIHVVKKSKCKQQREHGNCADPDHFSKPSLWKAGAEKVCGMLNLRASWPNLVEEMRAARDGAKAVTLRCVLLNAGDEFVSEGAGARSLAQDYDDLNKAIKMAKKSSYIDAALNAGGLSEVFTQDMGPEPTEGDGGGQYEEGAAISKRDADYLEDVAIRYFDVDATAVLERLARRRFQIDSGRWKEIPAHRFQDAVQTLDEYADARRSSGGGDDELPPRQAD